MPACMGCGCVGTMLDHACVVCQERDILRLENRLGKIREALGHYHVALLAGSTVDQGELWRELYRAVTAGADEGG
jgi:hypothetical protein